jgi:metal-responsive CopG/Arc/MetJ family transcriptional regulator
MPYEPYITVTLKKTVVKELEKVDPTGEKSVSAKVSDAIREYVDTKTRKPARGHASSPILRLSGTKSPPLKQY